MRNRKRLVGYILRPGETGTGAHETGGTWWQAVARAENREGYRLTDQLYCHFRSITAPSGAGDRELSDPMFDRNPADEPVQAGSENTSLFRRNEEDSFGSVGFETHRDRSLVAIPNRLQRQ